MFFVFFTYKSKPSSKYCTLKTTLLSILYVSELEVKSHKTTGRFSTLKIRLDTRNVFFCIFLKFLDEAEVTLTVYRIPSTIFFSWQSYYLPGPTEDAPQNQNRTTRRQRIACMPPESTTDRPHSYCCERSARYTSARAISVG